MTTKTKESQQTSSSSESGQDVLEDDESQSTETSPDSGDTPSGASTEEEPSGSTQSPFKHRTLQGRSPEEIERYVQTLEATTNEQGRTLTELHNRASQTEKPEAQPPEAEMPSAEDYWADPVNTLNKLINDAISPFKENLNATRASTAWDRARSELRNFSDYEPLIKTMLAQYNISAPTFENLKFLHTAAVGHVSMNGWPEGQGPSGGESQSTGQPRGETEETPSRPSRPNAPPQHPASSQPLPSGAPKKKSRELTESERRLAKEWGMTHEEYLRHQQAHADEVLTMEDK